MKRQTERLFNGALLLLWMGVIYCFSDQANSNELSKEIFASFNYIVRKGAHMAEYAILFVIAARFQRSFSKIDNKARVRYSYVFQKEHLPAFLFAVLYAASDELHQYFVPGRTALFSDVLIDASGALLAAIISSLQAKILART